jgi:hypothetical protein
LFVRFLFLASFCIFVFFSVFWPYGDGANTSQKLEGMLAGIGGMVFFIGIRVIFYESRARRHLRLTLRAIRKMLDD